VSFLLHRASLTDVHSSAAAGSDHSVFVDFDGRLLQKDLKRDSAPQIFPSVRDVHSRRVCSSSWVSLALSEEGKVCSWGEAGHSPEGDYPWAINQDPLTVPGLHAISVREIAAGAWHSAALTTEGALYTWSSWVGGPVPNGLG
jgi:hypothetical protein